MSGDCCAMRARQGSEKRIAQPPLGNGCHRHSVYQDSVCSVVFKRRVPRQPRTRTCWERSRRGNSCPISNQRERRIHCGRKKSIAVVSVARVYFYLQLLPDHKFLLKNGITWF